MSIWLYQALGMFIIFMVLQYLEKSAAMRGTKGTAIPDWLQRVLRFGFLSVMFAPFCVTYPILWIPFGLYMITYLDLSELKGGRRDYAQRWFIWKKMAGYFPLKLISVAPIDPSKQYVVGIHPHSIMPVGAMINLCIGREDVFPNMEVKALGASFIFYIPIYRDIMLALGCCDASRYCADRLLESGRSVTLVPGGATEALYCKPTKDVLYLRKRKGFIRLAILHGSGLIPVFSFNETCTFNQLSADWKFVNWAKKKFQGIFGISLPLITNIIPKRVPIVTVVGAPISVKKIENPTDAQVEAVLNQYIDALKQLYNEHRHYNSLADKELEII